MVRRVCWLNCMRHRRWWLSSSTSCFVHPHSSLSLGQTYHPLSWLSEASNRCGIFCGWQFSSLLMPTQKAECFFCRSPQLICFTAARYLASPGGPVSNTSQLENHPIPQLPTKTTAVIWIWCLRSFAVPHSGDEKACYTSSKKPSFIWASFGLCISVLKAQICKLFPAALKATRLNWMVNPGTRWLDKQIRLH